MAGDTLGHKVAGVNALDHIHTTTGEKSIAITANREKSEYFLVESALGGVRVLAHVLCGLHFFVGN